MVWFVFLNNDLKPGEEAQINMAVLLKPTSQDSSRLIFEE